MACSTTAVHSTVNRRVGGSNPPMPAEFPIRLTARRRSLEPLIVVRIHGGERDN